MGRAKKMWVQEAFSKNKGALHRSLKVPKGERIPEEKLEKAMHSKNAKLRKRAQLAETARHFHHEEGGRVKSARGGKTKKAAMGGLFSGGLFSGLGGFAPKYEPLTLTERASSPGIGYDPRRAYWNEQDRKNQEYYNSPEAQKNRQNLMTSLRAGKGIPGIPNRTPQPTQGSAPMQGSMSNPPGTLRRGGRAPSRRGR